MLGAVQAYSTTRCKERLTDDFLSDFSFVPYGTERNGYKMKKKIITLLLAAAVAVPMFNAFAYDEDEAAKYVQQTISSMNITTKKEYNEKSESIKSGLVNDYGLTDEEASKLIAEFENTFEDSSSDADNAENTGMSEDEIKADEIKKAKEKADIDYKRDMLVQLKLIANDYDLETDVSRGSFAVYMANLISYNKDYSTEKGYFDFNDVKDDSEFYSAVSMLVNKGAVIGIGEGLYAPNDSITVNQACAIAVRLMGYDIEKLPNDENDVYYYNKASEIKLLAGIKASRTEALSGADAVTFLYNMLDTNVYEMVVGDGEAFIYKDGTFLSKYMNVEWIEDIVTANSKTGLYSTTEAASKGRLRVGDYLFDFGDSAIDLDSFLGKRVRIYYNEDEPSEALAITVCSGYNESTTVKARDIEKYDGKNSRLYYDFGDKEEYFEIKKDASVIFNGYAVDYPYDKNTMFTPDVGDITFLSNDKNKGAEVIIINSYVYYTVGVMNSEVPTLTDMKKIQAESINLSDYDVTVLSNGEEISFGLIPKNSIVMVAPQRMKTLEKNGEKYFAPDLENSEYITLELCTATKQGSITGSTDSDGNIKIDKEDYVMSQTVVKNARLFPDNSAAAIPPVGADITAHLDKYGEIALIEITSYSGGLKYGYVKKMYEDEETGEYRAKIFTEDGEHIDVFLADKVKVHKKWDEGATLTKNSYSTKRIKNSVLYTLNGDKFNPQLIKFNLSGDGKLSEIYIADTTNKTNSIGTNLNYYIDDSIFMCSYTNLTGKVHPYYEIAGWYSTGGNTVAFTVPKNISGSIDSDYKVNTSGWQGLGVDNTEFYDISDAGVIGCTVRYAEVKATGTWDWYYAQPIIVLEDPTPIWDEKNEQVTYQIETYGDWFSNRTTKGEYKTRVFEFPEMVSLKNTATPSKENGRYTVEDYSNIPISSIKKGDILFVSTKDRGNNQHIITSFGVVYKNLKEYIENNDLEIGAWHAAPQLQNTFKRLADKTTLWTDRNNDCPDALLCGTCVKVAGNFFYFDANESGTIRRFEFNKNILGGPDLVAIYDAKKDKITAGTLSDIKEGDYCVTFASRFTVVVKNRY